MHVGPHSLTVGDFCEGRCAAQHWVFFARSAALRIDVSLGGKLVFA